MRTNTYKYCTDCTEQQNHFLYPTEIFGTFLFDRSILCNKIFRKLLTFALPSFLLASSLLSTLPFTVGFFCSARSRVILPFRQHAVQKITKLRTNSLDFFDTRKRLAAECDSNCVKKVESVCFQLMQAGSKQLRRTAGN